MKRGHGSKFSRKMENAVTALLTQSNMEAAARSVGISVATLLRWQKEPEFQTAYREARRAAATTLLKVMLDQGTPASVKVRAAECVMNHSSKAIEIEDVEFRVSELERATEAQKPGGRK
jgi:hypothetical protein